MPKENNTLTTPPQSDSLIVEDNDMSTRLYMEDPYLRSLAVERVPCFGAYSSTEVTCNTCPLRARCVTAISLRKATIAVRLDKAEIEAKRFEENQEKKKKIQDASVDEFVNLLSTTTDLKPRDRYQVKAKELCATKGTEHTLCYHCHKKFLEQQPCYWISGVGMFHKECVEVSP